MKFELSLTLDDISKCKTLEEAIISKMSSMQDREYADSLRDYYFANKRLVIIKKSVDARHRKNFRLNVRFCFESDKTIQETIERDRLICLPYLSKFNSISSGHKKPVIVGFGPAGMFAALILVSYGIKPIVLERGSFMKDRIQAVDDFLSGRSAIDPKANISFGEGGAGTFSDGKLVTGISSEYKRYILQALISYGAPKEILYDSAPHIGTDVLREVVVRLREDIESKGATVLFESRMIEIQRRNGCVSGVVYVDAQGNNCLLDTDEIILAPGHSSRDTFKYLYDEKFDIEAKPFSVGVRIEHLQDNIDMSQYGFLTSEVEVVSACSYRLAVITDDNRRLYTFCMCPGGYVVPSSHDNGLICTNGMSNYARDGKNSNSALLVPVDSSIYGDGVLDGLHFQEMLEKKAYIAGGSNGNAPVVRFGDLKSDVVSSEFGTVEPTYLPGTKFANFKDIFPESVLQVIVQGISKMGTLVRGFDDPDAILTAVETRSSSPVRILRVSNTMQSTSLEGLFPCGEGAGYAGGIMSSAVDGIKSANALVARIMEVDP